MPVTDDPEYALKRIDAARRALAEAKSVVDVKTIRDKAAAIEHYLRQQAGCEEAAADAAELKLRAERRLGELLKETVNHKGGRPEKRSQTVTVSNGKLPNGVSKMQSSRWQRVAAVPESAFEEEIARAKSKSEPPTRGAVIKRFEQAEKSKINSAPAIDSCRTDDLNRVVKMGIKFGTIYADPPWQYDNQGTRASTKKHYDTMPVEEIAKLPVMELAAEESHLHLWTTDSFLEDAMGLLLGWGFERRQTFVWVKPQLGIGNYWRSSHEYMLLGVRGGLTFRASDVKSWMEHDRTKHSAKPEAVRKLIERMSPGPRLELFGRQAIDGWVVWGNQITSGMFDADIKVL